MGFAGFLELYARKEEFQIVLLLRDSGKNRKKLAKYLDDPAVRIVWGDLNDYGDVCRMVTGADYVLHVGGMVSPAADYYPVKTRKTNVTAAQNIVRAVKAQPDPDAVKVVYIGSGEEYRLTNYEFEDLILGTLGMGSPKELFDPNWFTTTNFHGQWYYDGDELEKYCHFRANIPVKEYFRQMTQKVEFYYKLAFLARPIAPVLKHTWMKSIARTPEYGTLWWVENNVSVRMNAFYGGMEKYRKLPSKWADFEILSPSKKQTSPEVRLLDHGYDETKPFHSLTLEDLKRAAAFRGGECLATEIADMYTPVKWRSARGNEFDMSPNLVLRGGHWCPQELPWPWNYGEEARLNPFFAQVWTPLHAGEAEYSCGPEIFDLFKEKVTE